MTKTTTRNREKRRVPKPNVDLFLKKLPKVEINRRKDNYVKILKGNCYLKDVYYGIQILDNSHGKPGKVIGRIQNQKDINQLIKTIKENIKNYKPPNPKSKRTLSPNDKIEIMIRVATRDRLKSLKGKKDTYDSVVNQAIDSMVNR